MKVKMASQSDTTRKTTLHLAFAVREEECHTRHSGTLCLVFEVRKEH
jgi:hypothetical protein